MTGMISSVRNADVMKRIAAPMVGGLITSAFLTLEIIPVIYTYWRQEELLWERLIELDPSRLQRLKLGTWLVGGGLLAVAAILVLPIYVVLPASQVALMLVLPALVTIAGTIDYLVVRPKARALVWPVPSPA